MIHLVWHQAQAGMQDPFFLPITSKDGDAPFIHLQVCPGLLLINEEVPIDPPSAGCLDQALCAASVPHSRAGAPDGGGFVWPRVRGTHHH